MPGSPMQNSMFEESTGYIQKNNPYPVTSCGRRRNTNSPLYSKFDIKSEKKKNKRNWKSTEPRKTTKGKGRNFRTVAEGAGMTAAGVKKYRAKNPGSKLRTAVTKCDVKVDTTAYKRQKAFCSRSKSWKKERGVAARKRWCCSRFS